MTDQNGHDGLPAPRPELPEPPRGWPLRNEQLAMGNYHIGWDNYLNDLRIEAENAVENAARAMNASQDWQKQRDIAQLRTGLYQASALHYAASQPQH